MAPKLQGNTAVLGALLCQRAFGVFTPIIQQLLLHLLRTKSFYRTGV